MSKLIPFSNALWLLSWIVGPSAKGSEYGKPTSIKSTLDFSKAAITFVVSSNFGYPQVKYIDKRFLSFCWNNFWIEFIFFIRMVIARNGAIL